MTSVYVVIYSVTFHFYYDISWQSIKWLHICFQIIYLWSALRYFILLNKQHTALLSLLICFQGNVAITCSILFVDKIQENIKITFRLLKQQFAPNFKYFRNLIALEEVVDLWYFYEMPFLIIVTCFKFYPGRWNP